MSPRGCLAMSGDPSDRHHWGQGVCYWHLVGGGYEPSYNIWDSPSQQGIIWLQISIGLRLRNPGLEAKTHISTVHNSVHSHEAQTHKKKDPFTTVSPTWVKSCSGANIHRNTCVDADTHVLRYTRADTCGHTPTRIHTSPCGDHQAQ